MKPLQPLFQPRSITVIGASADPSKLGYIILQNIRDGGYRGELSAVNPKGELILDVPTYSSIDRVPGPVDLAVIVIPAAAVPQVAEACGQAGVRNLVIISAGFSELGGAGAAREGALKATIATHGLRLLGPNCLGVINPVHHLNASFAGEMPRPGTIAVLSQSGAMCTAILDWAKGTNLGFSAFVSVGNKADISENDLLTAWHADPHTELALGYLEGISDGREFVRRAGEFTRRKPFILIKAGVSEAGAAAASSHTGSLAGSNDVLNAALDKAGVTRAGTIEDVFDYATVFAGAPLPAGRRVAIVTNAGGAGVLTTDAVGLVGLTAASLSNKTQTMLKKTLPEEANVHNPVDVIGDARAARYQTALSLVLADAGVDAVLVLLTPQAMTEIVATAHVIVKAAANSDKPVLASFIGGAAVAPGLSLLQESGVPAYATPERAVRSLAALARYADYRRQPVPKQAVTKPPKAAIEEIRTVTAAGHRAMWGRDAGRLLSAYGIVTPANTLASSEEEAVACATEIGYPVVLKIDSPDILHKSDVGGVRTDLASQEEVRDAYATILKNAKRHAPQAKLRGVRVMQMVPEGHDFIVGGKRDAVFGPVVLFGYGGIYVEVFKDVAFALAPLSEADATSLVAKTNAGKLVAGVRGEAPLDAKALVTAIVGVSRLISDFPEISELDLNPLRVSAQGAVSLDSRIVLAEG